MDKGLTVPKWVPIVQLKISQMPQNLSAQFICPGPKVLDFNEKHELIVPKLVLIVWPKIPQIPKNLSAQFICPSPKVLDFNEKRLHWVSVV